MSEPAFKYVDASRNAVSRVWPDGRCESHLVDASEVQAWIGLGNTLEPADLAVTRASAFGALNAAFERAIARLTAGYPESEKLSWPKQEAEARAWKANAAAATPYIDALAVARGVPRAVYAQKTYDKVIAFQPASALAIGTRQGGEDAIKAAADEAAIGVARDAAVAALDGLWK